MDLRPSDVIFGLNKTDQYEIVRAIGGGAFGIVYEVRDTQGISYALKTISTAWLNEDALQSLANEGRLATQIQHENVVCVIYFHDGRQYSNLPPYMLMEYANGGTLQNLLSLRKMQQGYFDGAELRTLFIQMASGMKAINQKLVHRDIKPDNILLHDQVLKISDFGLSKVVGAITRTQTFKGINHIRYCAPEAWRLEKNLPAMDMYSMGIVFYEVATLQHPYQVKETGDFVEAWKDAHLLQTPSDPRTQNKSLDLDLAQLIMKMISKRPEDRYTSWDEVTQRLTSARNQIESSRDVSSLVERAIKSRHSAEQARLQAEEKARKQKEQEDLIAFSFKEVLKAAQETVEAFNQASEFAKLQVNSVSAFRFSISRAGNVTSKVQFEIMPVTEIYKLDNKTIKAWGYAKAPSGRGFNLVLVISDQDDLYGQWQTLHVKHSAFGYQRDKRLEPFPFELNELPREIELLKAMHIYSTKQGIFEPALLDELITELV